MDADVAAYVEAVEIADLEEALSFARTETDEGLRLFAVTAHRGGMVEGVDLSRLFGATDPIELLGRESYRSVAEAIRAASVRETVNAANLIEPVDLASAHVAAGTNYPEHADESQVEGGPFLFAKLVEPTGPFAPVSAGDALLDYEVELALVAMRSLDPLERAAGGLVLCNDFTDRAALLRNVDPRSPESGDGFTTGKSKPGYLPVGTLFVVPRDLGAFVAGLELTLTVSGELRQRSPVTRWVWNFDEILRQAYARRGAVWKWTRGEARLPFEGGRIPARTMAMAGTPAGTVFAGIDLGDKLRGVASYLFGGWSRPLPAHVIEHHIAAARAGGRYLRPGDVVAIRVDKMGVLANRIVP